MGADENSSNTVLSQDSMGKRKRMKTEICIGNLSFIRGYSAFSKEFLLIWIFDFY
jgi:hypothetical protein